MGFLDMFRRPAVANAATLADFLDRHAAFLVQKCVYEYARARSGVMSSKLMKEAAFKAAVEETRWRNYPLCLQCVALMVEGTLRLHSGDDAPAMRRGLAAAVSDVCGRYPVPPGFEPEFWSDARTAITLRIDQAGLAAPRAVKDIPREIAGRVFATLPIHADLRPEDRELITNNLRGNLCRIYEQFVAAADLPRLAAALAADATRRDLSAPA